MILVENPRQKQFADFVKSIPARFDQEGIVIYKKRNEIRVFEVDGVRLNVKKYKVPFILNRMIYTFIRSSKAARSFRYALKLSEKGIHTPEPIAYILIKRGGLLYESYFISMQLEGYRTMYEFGEGGIAGREPILDALAIFTAGLHEKGVYHKDYSPGNILFKAENDLIDFYIVDINRMQFGPVSIAKGCKNFARLWGQEPLFRLLAERYAQERKSDPDDCIKRVLQARERFWKRYTKKHPLPFRLDDK